MTDIETIASLAKRRGFAFQSSDIYGGLGSVWDYGPLGVELKNNIKRAWWRSVVYERDDMVGLDAGLLMNRLVWKYSGHEATFSDPLVDCRKCKARLRADKIEIDKCPECGSTDLTEPRQFNLMFRTTVGPVEDESGLTYLRPKLPREYSSTSKTSSTRQIASCPSVSRRSARRFAMRSRPATSSSEPGSSSRWRSSSS